MRSWLFAGALFALGATSVAVFAAPDAGLETVQKNADELAWTPISVGRSGDNAMALKGEVSLTASHDLVFRIEKEDGSQWQQPATLYLFDGNGPTCGDPQNTWTATSQVVVGEKSQYIILHDVTHYAGGWAVGETKWFWVGKSEGTHRSWRTTGAIDFVLGNLGK